ncbi:hypothetical protein TNCT_596421 [Trichonephila clavata]|uniref:Uncharacterized protein n=1 Tax=Trichonephila clavata TaxID=2740835 RepID=A0A8X6LN28_TRICU|nr:hypothetical protein TNCT_596421 [Trichonephila clavata]
MRALQPIPTSAHSNSSMFVPTNLKSCSHAFLRIDSVQPPLSQNYTGPHEEKAAILREKEKSVVNEEPVELVYERISKRMQFINTATSMANIEEMKRLDQSKRLDETYELFRNWLVFTKY